LLLAGYLRFALRFSEREEKLEPWMKVIYPLGLGLLLATHWGITLLGDLLHSPEGGLLTAAWWMGVITQAVALFIFWLSGRGFLVQGMPVPFLQRLISMGWLYQMFWWVYRGLSRLSQAVSQVFEGEGGILWAVLVLILLASVIRQVGGGV